MWRSVRYVISKPEISRSTRIQHRYSSSASSSGGGGKVVIGVLAVAGAGFAGAVVYGKFDPKFRKLLEGNIPYIDNVYKLFPEDHKSSVPSKKAPEEKTKDATSSSLLKKKLDREKTTIEAQKSSIESKTKASPITQGSDYNTFESNNVKNTEAKTSEQNMGLSDRQVLLENTSNENTINDIIAKLERSRGEAMVAHDDAVRCLQHYTTSLYEALDFPEGKDEDKMWRELQKAASDRNKALKTAEEKLSKARSIAENLKGEVRKASYQISSSPVIKLAEDSVLKMEQQLKDAEAEVSKVENEANTATEYQKLVNNSKEQFRRELEIMLPNYGSGDKNISESDLNVLIAHAHRRVEQLQKQLAKQQVTEKIRIEDAVRQQKKRNDSRIESKIEAELQRRHIDLESAISDRVASLKENFEAELRQQLIRQAAAHADHIQEVLKVQEQELERKFSLDIEEKLLHQKGVFISEVSGNMARLKGILAYLKARSEFDTATKKAQALWLACQAMSDKIAADNAGNPCPLGKDVAAVKISADEDSEFISSVLAGIPGEAVDRGVYNCDVLKQRFQDVKRVCRKVALIDENNDSLYRYILSYLQSFLIVDTISIPKEELEGKIAVDPSEWDTFDILSRVSYCLQINDLEQALRYANQLRGEPRIVAKDWMNEVKLFLETQLAVKALLAHAAAVGVQAYH